MRIIQLPNDVIDQIAAGEVVDRPSHLVKELVENAIDAGATKVEITVSEGGRTTTVSDNGNGIHPDDLPMAVARHATSKIRTSDDLWNLSSFGFRGEALASIAAVSDLTIISRTPSSKAFEMRVEFGKVGEVTETSAPIGTTITVKSLFENIPARLKFLKSESAEHLQIKKTIRALAMVHFQVEFRLTVREELTYVFAPSQSRLERVKTVLNQSDMYSEPIRYGSCRGEVVYGSPNCVEKTAQSLFFFVNQRWVQDKSLQAAVLESYRTLLMHGEYPVVAAFLEVSPEQVDVNVHPTKSQVKFADSKEAFKSLYSALRAGLEKGPWLSRLSLTQNDQLENPIEEPAPQMTLGGSSEFEKLQYAKKDFSHFASPRTSGWDTSVSNSSNSQKILTTSPSPESTSSSTSQKAPLFTASEVQSERARVGTVAINTEKFEIRSAQANDIFTGTSWSHLEVLGQAHLTYIVAQSRKSLMLVDQHAAHERILFERLHRQYKAGEIEVQNYLLPLTLELDESKLDAVMTMADELSKMGVEVDRGGPQTLVIRSGPAAIKESALLSVLHKMAIEISEFGGSYAFERKIADWLASMACHTAVRAGQSLSHEEMKSMLSQMDESPLSSFCPHGRPVFVEYPFRVIEGQFGRIV